MKIEEEEYGWNSPTILSLICKKDHDLIMPKQYKVLSKTKNYLK